MVFCQVCETKVQEGGNYCHNCGAGVESFQNGKSKYIFALLDHYCERNFDSSFLLSLDPEREIIERYFHLGYKYDVIINFLRSKHDICMNVRTLKRRLVKYKLSRNETWRSEEEVKNIIKEEMQGSGCLSGYRKMWHLLKIKYNMHVPRNMVAQILHDLDPEASSLRKKKKLKRRHYLFCSTTLAKNHATDNNESHNEKKGRHRRESGGNGGNSQALNAQCPPRLMRAHTFELSTEVFHFYGSIEVLRKTQEFYGRATFLRNSDGLYHGRARFLRNKLATVSTEQLFF